MNWDELLGRSAYWGKWILVGYCFSHTYLTLQNQSTLGVALVTLSTAAVGLNWLNKQRK